MNPGTCLLVTDLVGDRKVLLAGDLVVVVFHQAQYLIDSRLLYFERFHALSKHLIGGVLERTA